MSVILNEVALKALLDTEDGPVGRHVETIAARVTAEAQRNIKDYFFRAPSITADLDVGYEMEGSSAVIGIKDAGNKSRRMAQAQAEGKVNWLLRALQAVR